MMKRLYILGAIAEILAILSYIWYLPCIVLNALSDYIYTFAGFADTVDKDEQEIIDEMNEEDDDTRDV